MKYMLLVPGLIFFSLFTAWPIIEVFRLSVYKTNFITSSFVGMENYIISLRDPVFIRSMINSLMYIIFLVIGQVLASLFFSLLLYPMSKKWQDNSRILLYVPMLSAGIIIAQSWRWIFHADGPINWILGLMGISVVNWFGEYTAIPIVSFIVVFSSFGGNVIIMLASLQAVNRDFIEAATIDGASWNQIKLKILIPLIGPTIGMVGILSAIAALQIFETIYALAPYEYSATMTYHIYRQGFQFGKYGMASAQAVILLIITIILSRIKGKIEK